MKQLLIFILLFISFKSNCQQIDTIIRAAPLGSDYAHWSPNDNEIVFTSNFSGTWQVYKRDVKTKNLIRLTHHEGNDDGPVWSPDGKRIIYEREHNGKREIWIMNADGSENKSVTTKGMINMHPTWHPNGEWILFNSNRDDTSGVALYKIKPDGTQLTRLTKPTEMRTYAWWSPDGKKIVFVRWFKKKTTNGLQGDISVMNEDGSNEINLTGNEFFDGWPTWSPDGKKIIFSSDRTGKYQVHTINADGTGVKQLVFSDHNDRQPFWSNDGKKISFARNIPGIVTDIYVVKFK